MGTVWRGTDEVLGRDVAVKEVVYPPELAEDEREMRRERTLREARAVARITHPSVVTVYDVVREDERPWIVMELVAGRSLADLLAEDGPLPAAQAAQIGIELLAALERVHDVGVLHRDIKPANVLLAEDGRVVLTDFGIAFVEGDPSLTSTGLVLGSPAFMAPERARPGPVGPPADLWGVGATLYAAVEGRPPFERSGPLATVTAVVTDPPDPLTVSGPLREVIEGLLVKDADARFDVGQARGLLRVAASQPVRPVPPRPPAEPARPVVVAATPTASPGQDKAASPGGSAQDLASGESAPTGPASVSGGDARRSWRRPVLTGLVAALAVAGVLAYGFAGPAGRDGNGADRQADPSSGSGRQTVPPSSASAEPSGAPSSTPTSAPGATASQAPGPSLPPGFKRHTDPTGFSVAVPREWHRERNRFNIDFSHPRSEGGRFLRIGHSGDPKPDPVADWKKQEQWFKQRFPDYRRIRIEAVKYRDYDAADWEFVFRTGEGKLLHVINRAAVTSRDHAYAIYWSTPQQRWRKDRSYFDVFARTFRPAP